MRYELSEREKLEEKVIKQYEGLTGKVRVAIGEIVQLLTTADLQRVAKTLGLMMFLFSVSWELNFRPWGGEWERQLRTKEVTTNKEAIQWIRRAPKENAVFECQDSSTGRTGHCFISQMEVHEYDGSGE